MKENLSKNCIIPSCTHISTKNPKSNDFYTSHIHNHYELLFFCDGDADFIISGTIYHMKKNDLLLIKPNAHHHLRILSARPYERTLLNFEESDLLEELRPIAQNADDFYPIEPSSPIKHIFENLQDCENVFSEEDFACLVKTSLQQIILHLKYFSSHTVKEEVASKSTLEKILLYIDENPTLPLTIADLAKKFNLSESWIAHSFKKVLGISPSQYINRKKIFYAQSLIRMGMHPVQAAEACGYVNYTTFYRQYKKYLSVSPADDAKKD